MRPFVPWRDLRPGSVCRCAKVHFVVWCGTGLVQRLDAVDISSTSGGGIVMFS